jgi:hypothetical protein
MPAVDRAQRPQPDWPPLDDNRALTWSDCGGEIERRFSKDQLRTNIFAAMEEPALLVDDVRAFFRTLR